MMIWHESIKPFSPHCNKVKKDVNLMGANTFSPFNYNYYLFAHFDLETCTLMNEYQLGEFFSRTDLL